MRRAALVLLSISITSAAWAQAAPVLPDRAVTLNELILYSRSVAPATVAGRAHLQAVRAQEVTAGLKPNPVFTSSNEDFNVDPDRFDIDTQEFTQNVSQLFERGQKRRRRIESARGDSAVAENAFTDAQRAQELQIKTAFVAVLLAKANLALATANLGDYKEVVELNRVRMNAGDISQNEFDRIHLQQAQFEGDLMNAQLALTQARLQLGALLGLQSLPAHFDVVGTLEAPALNLSFAELQQAALANRPDYLGALNGITKSQADVRLAFANGATDFTAGVEYKRNGPENTVGFTFQVPLRIHDRNQGEKLRSQHELEASRATEQQVRAQVLADVAQAFAAYRVSRERAQLYSSIYLGLAETVRARTEFSFRNAGTTLLDYLDAVRSYRDVELAARSAQAQLLTSIHQLSFATATELLK